MCYRESTSPLALFGLPLPTSFGIFDSYVIITPLLFLKTRFLLVQIYFLSYPNLRLNPIYRSQVLADPTAFEEPLLDGTISIVFGGADQNNSTPSDDDGQLLSVTQQGLGIVNDLNSGSGLGDKGVLEACIKAGKKRRVELAKIVREAIV